MASYFDPQPASKPAADEYGNPTILTPQVTRILDDLDLDLEAHSSSDFPNLSSDTHPDPSNTDNTHDPPPLPPPNTSSTPDPTPANKHIRLQELSTPGLGTHPTRQKHPHPHPHLARFQSLRTMLFHSHVEQNMDAAKCTAAREAEAAAHSQWKSAHDGRKAFVRPKTPDSPPSPREGFARKLGSRLRRMASREVSGGRDGRGRVGNEAKAGNESTASSDDEMEEEEEEGIGHGDVEDLVRWVSRRDPPSDGEARRRDARGIAEEGVRGGRESLGNSDVEELVRWVSRRSVGGKEEESPQEEVDSYPHLGFSDASTESDSESPARGRRSMDEEDVDDLVRWVSRRDGPNAGPVRRGNGLSYSGPTLRGLDSDDDVGGQRDGKGTLTNDDVDELVRWVSRRDTKTKEVQGQDPSPESKQDDDSLGHEHIEDIAQHVRGDDTTAGASQVDSDMPTIQEVQREKREKIGMKNDEGSLHQDDVAELVQWVSRK